MTTNVHTVYECCADALNRGDLVQVNVARQPLDTPDQRWLELIWIDVLVDDDHCTTGQIRLTFAINPRHHLECTVSDDQVCTVRKAVP